jgi:hypothetical protein
MNDERAAGEPLGELLRLAEMRIKRPLWKGPKGTANRLLESIRNLEGVSVGTDWTDCLPEDLIEIWPTLSAQSQVAAFLVAADRQFQLAVRAQDSR